MNTYMENLGKNLRGVAGKNASPSNFNKYCIAYSKAQAKYLPRGSVYKRITTLEINNFFATRNHEDDK